MNTPPPPLSNAQAAHVRKLSQKKYRTEYREYVLEGARIVSDAVQSEASLSLIAATPECYHQNEPLFGIARSKHIPIYIASEKQFRQIADTVEPQGIIAIAPIPQQTEAFHGTIPRGPLVYLHEIQDPGNLGTIIRSCDWFGAGALFLSPGSADPYNPKAVRASMGSILRIPVYEGITIEQLTEFAGEHRYTLFAADSNAAVPLFSVDFPENALFFFGSEAHGLPAGLPSERTTPFIIPRSGAAESLNLSISHAITLAEYRRQNKTTISA